MAVKETKDQMAEFKNKKNMAEQKQMKQQS